MGVRWKTICRGCSPHEPLTTRDEAGASIHYVHTVDPHDVPYQTLKASLRGYLVGEVQVPPKGHTCQSPQCVRITKFKEVPTHLHLVIQRGSVVSQPRLALAMCHFPHHTQLACPS